LPAASVAEGAFAPPAFASPPSRTCDPVCQASSYLTLFISEHTNYEALFPMAKQCPTCLEHFKTKNALKCHTGTTDPSLRVPHMCPKCDRRFCSQRAMEQHRDSPNHPTTSCEVCSRTFGSNQGVADHRGSRSHKSMVDRAERARQARLGAVTSADNVRSHSVLD
jgi:hypothetical protein